MGHVSSVRGKRGNSDQNETVTREELFIVCLYRKSQLVPRILTVNVSILIVPFIYTSSVAFSFVSLGGESRWSDWTKAGSFSRRKSSAFPPSIMRLLAIRSRGSNHGPPLLLPLTLLAMVCALATPADAVSLRDLFRAALGPWRSSDAAKAEILSEAEVDEGESAETEELPWRRDEEVEEGDEEEGREGAEVEEGKVEEGGAEVAAPAEHHPLLNPMHHHHHPGHHHHPVITIYATMTHYIQVTSTKHTIPMCVTAAVPSLPTCPTGGEPADGGPHLEHSVFTHRAFRGEGEELGDSRSKGARAMKEEAKRGVDDQKEEELPLDEQEDRMLPMRMKPMGWSLFGQKHHHVHHHIHKNKKDPMKSPLMGLTGEKPLHPLHPAHPSHPMHPSNLLGLGNLANGIVDNVGGAGWWGGGRPWGGDWGGGHIVQHHGEPYLGPHHHHHLVTELLTRTKVLTKVVTRVNHNVRATLVAQNCLPDASMMEHCDAHPYAPTSHPGLLADEAPYAGLFYGLHPDLAAQSGSGPYPIPNPPYEAHYREKDGDDPEDVEPSAETPAPAGGLSGRTPPLLWAAQLLSTGGGKTLHYAGAEEDANEVEEEHEMEWTG